MPKAVVSFTIEGGPTAGAGGQAGYVHVLHTKFFSNGTPGVAVGFRELLLDRRGELPTESRVREGCKA